MAVFVHICDLMFLDDSSFHYEPYYEVVVGEVPNLSRITLVTLSPIIKAQPDILFRFPLFVSHAGVRSLWLPVAPCGCVVGIASVPSRSLCVRESRRRAKSRERSGDFEEGY